MSGKVKRDRQMVPGVVSSLCKDIFVVRIDSGQDITCRVKGILRKNKISVLPGDKVTVELCMEDTSKGFITYRTK